MATNPDRDYSGWTKYVWLIYIVPFAASPVLAAASARTMAVTFAATAFFVALYLVEHRLFGYRAMLGIVAMVALGVAFMPTNYGAGAFFIFAASFSGSAGGPKRSFAVTGCILLVLLVDVKLIGLSPLVWWWSAFFTVAIGAVNAHFAQVARSNRRLRMAHEEIEHLAKLAERERIARDLHDVLGHTLSLIILKSELASKLSDRDPARAREEIRDVERISREALSEVRHAVRGYRAGLQHELDAAAMMLRVASIELTTQMEPLPFAPAQEAILALALREAVTNVVRHSGASRCTIELRRVDDALSLTVRDDGRGGVQPDGAGISGMRERIATLGGHLVRSGIKGTTLTLTLPLATGPQSLRTLGQSA